MIMIMITTTTTTNNNNDHTNNHTGNHGCAPGAYLLGGVSAGEILAPRPRPIAIQDKQIWIINLAKP